MLEPPRDLDVQHAGRCQLWCQRGAKRSCPKVDPDSLVSCRALAFWLCGVVLGPLRWGFRRTLKQNLRGSPQPEPTSLLLCPCPRGPSALWPGVSRAPKTDVGIAVPRGEPESARGTHECRDEAPGPAPEDFHTPTRGARRVVFRAPCVIFRVIPICHPLPDVTCHIV